MGFELGLMGQAFFRGGLLTLPAAENRFTMAGKSACHGK